MKISKRKLKRKYSLKALRLMFQEREIIKIIKSKNRPKISSSLRMKIQIMLRTDSLHSKKQTKSVHLKKSKRAHNKPKLLNPIINY
jgi:hypothetical protein